MEVIATIYKITEVESKNIKILMPDRIISGEENENIIKHKDISYKHISKTNYEDGSLCYYESISLEEINELINILESNNIFHWLETNKGVYMNIEKYGNEVLKRRQFFPKFLESVKPKNEECLSIINKVSYIDPLNPLSFEEKLLSGKFILVPMSYDGQGENRGEISAIGTTKGTAIRYVLNKLNIPKKNAYCFGDSNNDLSMFPEVGTSICMGNGKDEVKKHASFVTKNIDDGGIEFGFKNFGLI